MKTYILVIVCLLLFIGCITYQPVASMTDLQLENEHYRLQVKQTKLKRALRYRIIRGTTAHKRTTLILRKVKNRRLDVEGEILKRLEKDLLSM
jgi:hypothetical protein